LGLLFLKNGVIAKEGKMTSNTFIFIACLASSDFASGLIGIIGTYREDLGRTIYYWPNGNCKMKFLFENEFIS